MDRIPIILLNRHRILPHGCHPRHMSHLPGVRLRDTPHLGRLVHRDARLPRRLVPLVCIAPRLTLILVMKLQTQPLVDPPGDEADALALVVEPGVDAVAPVALAFVGVVVCDGAGEFGGGWFGSFALFGDEAVFAGFDVVVGYVAVVRGLVPDVVARDGFAGGLAGDGDVFAFGVGLLDGVAGSWAGAAVYAVAFDGVGGGEGEGCCLEEEGEEGELHFGVGGGRFGGLLGVDGF